MLNLITGKQRSGKSYFCVTLILDYLGSCNRPIYTNLPIHPDIICKYYTCNPAKYSSALKRIHVFKSFRSFGEIRAFYKKNPDWCKLHNLLPEEKIKDYWLHTQPNSIIFLDEVYQWFSAQGFKDAKSADRRKQLLTYTRQHGHYKDDMFLISHQPEDVDINIRRGVQYLYFLENAKYKNIFNWVWLKGLKYPVQFFIIKGFEFGEKEHSDSWCLYPKRRIFKCYDSFSAAESIPGKAMPDADAQSTDTGVNFWKNLFSFFRQSWIGLVIVIFVVVLIHGFYKFYVDLCKNKSGVKIATKAKNIEKTPEIPAFVSPSQPPRIGEGGNLSQNDNSNYVSAISVSNSMIVFADGFKLRLGDIYNDLLIKRIFKSYVLVENQKTTSVTRISISKLHSSVAFASGNMQRNNVYSQSAPERKSFTNNAVQSIVPTTSPQVSSFGNNQINNINKGASIETRTIK